MLFAFAGCELDLRSFELRRDGVAVPVEPLVLELLSYLLRNRERVVTREELLDSVRSGQHVLDGALTRAVKEARRAVGDDGNAQRIVRTVRGRGYQLVAPVEVSSGDAIRDPSADGDSDEPFIERESVVAALRQALASALAGRGKLLLLAGDAGIGKTRTAQHGAALARSQGAEVHFGRCLEGEGAPAFWPWLQIARSLLDSRDARSAETLLGPHGPDIAEALPELRDRLSGASAAINDPVHARFRFFDGITQVLQRASKERPQVVVLEDLHQADCPSLELLRFVARELDAASLLIIGTYRDAQAQKDRARAALLADLARQPATAVSRCWASTGPRSRASRGCRPGGRRRTR